VLGTGDNAEHCSNDTTLTLFDTDGIILEKLDTKGTSLAENESADTVFVDNDSTLRGIDFFDSKA